MKKIKLTESDLYRIVRKVLLEQEEENNRRIFNKNPEYFKTILENVFRNDSEKLTRVFNKQYDKVIINGDLDLRDTQIQSLPDNLHVGGSLYLQGTPIQSLPDNLHVGGSLYLRGTPIQSLPDNLHVEGDLFLGKTPIQSLPNNLDVKGTIYIKGTPLNDNDELVKKYEEKYRIIRV